MKRTDFAQTTQPEAAHAASEFNDDDRAGHDTGMEMLGGLIAIAAGLALGGACAGFILAQVFK
jgi:hypothetical protein